MSCVLVALYCPAVWNCVFTLRGSDWQTFFSEVGLVSDCNPQRAVEMVVELCIHPIHRVDLALRFR